MIAKNLEKNGILCLLSGGGLCRRLWPVTMCVCIYLLYFLESQTVLLLIKMESFFSFIFFFLLFVNCSIILHITNASLSNYLQQQRKEKKKKKRVCLEF